MRKPMKAPILVQLMPRERLMSHLRRAKEEATGMAHDGTDIGEALAAIKEAIAEIRATNEERA